MTSPPDPFEHIPADATRYSFSRLSTYRGCGKKYQLSYIEGVEREPQGALIGGSAIHQVMDLGEENGWWADEPEQTNGWLRRAFYTTFHELCATEGTPVVEDGEVVDYSGIRWGGRKTKTFPAGENVQWWEREGPVMLQRWASVRREDDKLGHRIVEGGSEMAVSAVLPDGAYVVGYIDATLITDADGTFRIRDAKSGTWEDPSQLAVYGWIVREALGWHAPVGELLMLRRRTNPLHIYDIESWIDLVPEMFANLTKGIEAEIFPIVPSNLCPGCTVRAHCPWGRHLP